MRPKSRKAEQVIARIASSAKGVVTREELLDAEITPGEIKHRLGNGALIRKYPGVYRVGHAAPSVEADYMAAVKACGRGAVLRRRAAGWFFGVLRGQAPPPEVTA